MKLVARYPILYQSTQYQVGESLPQNNPEMVQAWIEAGTAAWVDDTAITKPVKVTPATAEPGLAGDSRNGETQETLIGKVPKTPTRKRGGRKSG